MIKHPFAIVGIYIHEKCKKRKVLQAGYYSLNDAYAYENGKVVFKGNALSEDFFGKNISISAIVGKNGTGKSSLVEIIFRMISNLWFNIGRDKLQFNKKWHKSNFIAGVVADLYFTTNGKICKFSCNTNNTNEVSVLEFTPRKDAPDFDEKIRNAIKLFKNSFFYTIVSNYSVQSYISRDYSNEIQTGGKGVWIDRLFHKNDGYSMPIVLNPYRQNGIINLNTEFDLTNDRLISILIEIAEQNKKKNYMTDIPEFFEHYILENIHYSYNIKKVLSKYVNKNITNAFKDRSESYFKKKADYYIEDFMKTVNNKNSFAHQFLKGLDLIHNIDNWNEHHIIALMYIVDKIFKINAIYYKYEYIPKALNGESYPYNVDISVLGDKSNKKISNLIDKIKDDMKDNSHITLKLRRAIYFIEKKAQTFIDTLSFNYLEYLEKELAKQPSSSELLNYLPPPFFTPEITFKRKNDPNGKTIYLNQLSSGERQFAYGMTTVIYHIKNLMSVPSKYSDRFKYKNFNIILDETELCFHPELQRTFVYDLIAMIKRLHLNVSPYKLNIIILTHSPFVLSDIPMSNILLLEKKDNEKESKPIIDKSEFINPFAANINDILAQSFFLNQGGFIGEYAKTKIQSAIRWLEGEQFEEDSYWDKNKIRKFIDIIGEPLIKNSLKELYLKKFSDIDSINEEIKNLNALKEEKEGKNVSN